MATGAASSGASSAEKEGDVLRDDGDQLHEWTSAYGPRVRGGDDGCAGEVSPARGKGRVFLDRRRRARAKSGAECSQMGRTPQAHADEYAAGFQALNARLGISNDYYVRTSSKMHEDQVRTLWRRVRDVGDIYLTTYEGWYNVHEEQYVTDTEAATSDYKDQYGRPFEKKCEESYFFRMSKYQDRLIEHIKANPAFIQPATRRSENAPVSFKSRFVTYAFREQCASGVSSVEDPDYTGKRKSRHVRLVRCAYQLSDGHRLL